MIVTVYLAASLLCIDVADTPRHCYRALVGRDTPTGSYKVQRARLLDGDALVFAPSRPGYVFAVHAVRTPHRAALLASSNRRNVTHGCVNVRAEVFDVIEDGASLHIIE